ncbi:MAG TPA: xanthine phosphoribosyltransferase [Clostridiales bacterium]|nr:xanthine phosphoribosyltransferase [Clostridiales bacterium]
MKALEDRILKEGVVLPGQVLKVGSFLNQKVDTSLMMLMGQEAARVFAQDGVTKVLTVEASGIPLAFATANAMGVPLVVAKKHKSANVSGEVLKAPVYSYTHKQTYEIVVSKDYIDSDDVVLIADDFLATGNALMGLTDIVHQQGARVAGAAIAIEKGFQKGGDTLREKGMKVLSMAIVDEMTDDGRITFRKQ